MTFDPKKARELLQAATPGPWELYAEYWGYDIGPDGGRTRPSRTVVRTMGVDRAPDAQLITYLVNHASELIGMAERIDRALEELGRYRDQEGRIDSLIEVEDAEVILAALLGTEVE